MTTTITQMPARITKTVIKKNTTTKRGEGFKHGELCVEIS